ncbi:aldose 1-epimerase [Lichenicola cladoniae]|uniref:Aldose 1-epimerase n=1 Tax=Lichenicola cladoniae TaxID=1484109 RepID=A0A6M8HN12_9PROT|nr:aldose 1-epimerase [Lichenicola cladoniae]NPD67187.1 aldose 1-epimerase [Acetobacteraceae bacterium]QKE89706.1 aldose 1-epimerase [Lichenicola cladoniae]
MLELKAGQSVLGLRPDIGGAVGFWIREGKDVLHPVIDPNLVAQKGQAVAAYPLIPFSNRIANGRFEFEGEQFQLDRNFGGEPHAIHGNAWERAWDVVSQGPAQATLSLDHAPPRDPPGQWPFCYHAEIDYALRDDGLTVTIRVRNTDHRAQPVGLGFHPFYPRGTDLEIGFSAASVWEVGQDSLPAERLAVEGDWSFAPMRAVEGAALDNCYAGWGGSVFLRWPVRGLSLTMSAASPFDHLVVYTPPGRPYIAAEPASNMTDAINRPDIPDRGLAILQPGETLTGVTEFSLARL